MTELNELALKCIMQLEQYEEEKEYAITLQGSHSKSLKKNELFVELSHPETGFIYKAYSMPIEDIENKSKEWSALITAMLEERLTLDLVVSAVQLKQMIKDEDIAVETNEYRRTY
jgi:hypothetical protein